MRAKSPKPAAKRYYRKRVDLFRLISRIKLWPSRQGVLHGIKSIDISGGRALVSTHCSRQFTVRNSRNSRAARWLRNKWFHSVCPDCAIPDWKLEKYAATRFSRKSGSDLRCRTEYNSIGAN